MSDISKEDNFLFNNLDYEKFLKKNKKRINNFFFHDTKHNKKYLQSKIRIRKIMGSNNNSEEKNKIKYNLK